MATVLYSGRVSKLNKPEVARRAGSALTNSVVSVASNQIKQGINEMAATTTVTLSDNGRQCAPKGKKARGRKAK